MPIVQQIQNIVGLLDGAPTFLHGTVNELNRLADDSQFPCVFMYPITPISIMSQVNGSVDNTFDLYLEFLFKTEFDQFTSQNDTYVSQALHLANQFVVKTSNYREGNSRYFKMKADERSKAMPVYNKFDVNTTGIGLQIKLRTMAYELLM
jgi:hypothetical protein